MKRLLWRLKGPAVGLVSMMHPSVGDAQARVRIEDVRTCSACTIRLEELAIIRAPDTARAFDRHTFLAPDSRGGYLVSNGVHAENILLFDSQGRFVRAIGKAGDGPGEFRNIAALVVSAGDTIHAFSTHHTVFSWSGEFIRSHYVLNGARINRALSLPGGKLLLQAMVATPELAGLPLHIADSDGRVLKSFGALPGEYTTGQFWERFRAIALSRAGGFWSLAPNRYEVGHWSGDGELQRVLVRQCSWCASWDTWSGAPARDRPPAIFGSVMEDTTGLLWVLTSVSDAKWTPYQPTAGRREAPPPPMRHEDAMWDSILEVIDPSEGRLVHMQRFPLRYWRLLPGNRLWRLEERDDEVRIIVLRAALTGR